VDIKLKGGTLVTLLSGLIVLMVCKLKVF